VKYYKEYLWYPVIYGITVLLLTTFRFLEIRTCETTDELRQVIISYIDDLTTFPYTAEDGIA
jgi:hypothetical protein